MSTTIRCDIVSAEEEIFHGEVVMVVATGEMGELGIAPRHAPLITRLKPGKLVLTLADGEKLDIVVSGGILEVQPGSVTVLGSSRGAPNHAAVRARSFSCNPPTSASMFTDWPLLARPSSWIFASRSAMGCSKSRKFGFIRGSLAGIVREIVAVGAASAAMGRNDRGRSRSHLGGPGPV